MVITINEKNQKLYNDFFIESYKIAKENNILEPDDLNQDAFANLWQFYHYLPALGAKNPVFYTKLPLDEPMMEINGDSREIKVPAQLAKCAGIESDHMAESIMFYIDRFHDGKDLTSATIWIQWKAEDGTEGTTAVPHIDTEFAENKIRFPWPITSEITAHPGIIEFSAAFFMMIEGRNEVAYRYNTLPAKIRIEPALQKTLENNPLDVGGLFASAVKTSSYGPGYFAPANPSFDILQSGIDLNKLSNLNYDNDDIGSLVLEVRPTVTDTGIISYEWKYNTPDGTYDFACGENVSIKVPKDAKFSPLEEEFLEAYEAVESDIENDPNNKLISYSFGEVQDFLKPVNYLNEDGNVIEGIVTKIKSDKFNIYYDQSGNNLTSAEVADAINKKQDIFEKIATFELPHDKKTQPVTGFYFVVATSKIEANGKTKYSTPIYSTKTELISPDSVSISNSENKTITFTDKKVELDPELNRKDGEEYIIKLFKNISSPIIDTETATPYASIEIKNDSDSDKMELDLDKNGIGWYQAQVIARRNRQEKKGNTRVWRVVENTTLPALTYKMDIQDHINNVFESAENPMEFNVEIDDGQKIVLGVGVKDGDTVKDFSDYYNGLGFAESLISDAITFTWVHNSADSSMKLDSYSAQCEILGAVKHDTVVCTITNDLNGIFATKEVVFTIL